jgi:hypothetical protein
MKPGNIALAQIQQADNAQLPAPIKSLPAKWRELANRFLNAHSVISDIKLTRDPETVHLTIK